MPCGPNCLALVHSCYFPPQPHLILRKVLWLSTTSVNRHNLSSLNLSTVSRTAGSESFHFECLSKCNISFPIICSFTFPLREGCGMLALFIPLRGCGAYWGKIQFYSWAKARVHPEWVASSLQDPYWCILFKDTSTCPTPGELGIWTIDLPITGPPVVTTNSKKGGKTDKG